VLATFVIGLREGLEAALIVGIVAGFLKRQGPPGALRSMWFGVGGAVAICVLVGVVLELVAVELPQAGQEAMSTVIGLIAVGMVTYMIFWMRSHARGMRRELESAAASAIDRGSSTALVAMAFLAVLREGFETAVFLVAQFTSSIAPVAAVSGAVLGIAVSVALGYGIYRGSVRINLGRFFTITAVVLVIVAAGILTTAAHTAHGAGWIASGQDRFVDLSGVVSYGTPMYSIVTGVFGIQPRPTVLEGIVWVIYLVPMLVFVLWPQRRRTPAASPTSTTAVTATATPDPRDPR
jgi:high-affinity iron transporter